MSIYTKTERIQAITWATGDKVLKHTRVPVLNMLNKKLNPHKASYIS